MAEPSGQLLIDFDASRGNAAREGDDAERMAIPITPSGVLGSGGSLSGEPDYPPAEEMRSLAAELEEEGRIREAIEVYRSVLASGEFTADDHFALAELLYREGDLPAARERYYMSIELDENFVEARSNLGCVLEEQGELELAEAAFHGALSYHPNYADAHYHLARLLDRAERAHEALRHWKRFMELAPASPWSDEARERVMGAATVE
jgi:tetratricopeptide (TPR) repeat protein